MRHSLRGTIHTRGLWIWLCATCFSLGKAVRDRSQSLHHKMDQELPHRYREQFVVVEGSFSTSLQVLSGDWYTSRVVLGPLLSIIYINNMVWQISNGSKINLFADDITLYRIIYTPNDYNSLQSNIHVLLQSTWASMPASAAACCSHVRDLSLSLSRL